jgi:hypothetical protein
LLAVTVKVEELPAVIDVGLAEIATLGIPGGGAAVTVTIATADAFPPAPDTLAVYVVVALGLTACVPPLGCNL